MMSRLGLTAAVAFFSWPAIAETVPMTAQGWETGGEAAFVEHDGRAAIRLGTGPGVPLSGGVAVPRVDAFGTGVIEFDVWVHGGRDFVQLAFRNQEEGHGELFYIRPLQSGNPDSTQYTPVVHGVPAWQIFTGEGHTSAVEFGFGRWMHVRADVHADSALISIDGRPALEVHDLKTDYRSGSLALGAAAGAYFSNFRVERIAEYPDPTPSPPPPPPVPGTVARWSVSEALPEADALRRAGDGDWSGVDWHEVPVETNGIANLSRAGPRAEGRNTMIARFTLDSPAERLATMQFGFSDRVRIFLNKRALYAGADSQGSRDYRFLGIVGFWDTLFLALRPGENEVVFVVGDDRDGGIAAAARFDPPETVRSQ